MSLSFLWIVPKWPVPPADGFRVASRNLLKGVLAEGAQIHLVVVPAADEARPMGETILGQELPVASVTILPRRVPARGPTRLMHLGVSWVTRPHRPLTAASFRSPGVSSALNRLTRDFRGDLVVYDGLHVAAHLLERRGSSLDSPYLLRAHNKETELWRQKALLSRTLPERLFFAAQAAVMARFEGAVASRARGVAVVSEHDRSLFLKEVPGLLPERVVAIPIGYEFGSPPPFPDANPWRILFIGRLDWPPNREGLQWFLENVWPSVVKEAPQWHLTVVGGGSSAWLDSYRRLPRLEVHGFADDLTGLYERSSLTILPLFVGSGTRVKAIEASRFGRASLSTSLGVEGLGLRKDVDYLAAETAQEWRSRLVTTSPLELKLKGHSAWQALRDTFDLPAPARAFLDFSRAVARASGGR